MTKLIALAAADRIAPGEAAVVSTEDGSLVLYRLGNRIGALDAWCARCGALLAQGPLAGTVISCSGCNWRYDVTTGCVDGLPALRLDTFDVSIIDGICTVEMAVAGDVRPFRIP